jgi:hypothetical protein
LTSRSACANASNTLKTFFTVIAAGFHVVVCFFYTLCSCEQLVCESVKIEGRQKDPSNRKAKGGSVSSHSRSS